MSMEKPAAGVQLKRWFTFMVALLVFVNVAAVVCSIIIYTSVHTIAKRYQPFAAACNAAERYTILAQRDMYEYLSELSDSTKSTLRDIDLLIESMDEANKVAPGPEQEAALSEIKKLTGQYRLAVEQLPSVVSGSKDWGRMEEIRKTAVRYGGEVAKRTGDLSAWAQGEIRARNTTSAMITTVALVTFVVVMITSVVVLLILNHWWRRFQDMILGI